MTNKQKLDSWLLKYKESLEEYRLIQSVITLNMMNTKRAYDRGDYELVRQIKSKRSSLKNGLRVIESNLKNCKNSIKRYGSLYSLECELSEKAYWLELNLNCYPSFRSELIQTYKGEVRVMVGGVCASSIEKDLLIDKFLNIYKKC